MTGSRNAKCRHLSLGFQQLLFEFPDARFIACRFDQVSSANHLPLQQRFLKSGEKNLMLPSDVRILQGGQQLPFGNRRSSGHCPRNILAGNASIQIMFSLGRHDTVSHNIERHRDNKSCCGKNGQCQYCQKGSPFPYRFCLGALQQVNAQLDGGRPNSRHQLKTGHSKADQRKPLRYHDGNPDHQQNAVNRGRASINQEQQLFSCCEGRRLHLQSEKRAFQKTLQKAVRPCTQILDAQKFRGDEVAVVLHQRIGIEKQGDQAGHHHYLMSAGRQQWA